jgi:hypothetical protein
MQRKKEKKKRGKEIVVESRMGSSVTNGAR